MVKSTGKSYAETVRAMKAAIDPDEIGVTVQKTEKTREGNVRIVVKERKPGAKATLADRIVEKIESAEVKMQTKETVLIIRDLDDSITKDEIKEAILGITPLGTNAKIGDIREGSAGTFSATVSLLPEGATEILKKGRIKIGWIRCRISEKLTPMCCYKCQAFGHYSSSCKEPSSAKKCLKCGKEDHIAKTCQNQPHCYICKLDGHRADSMACPEYRKAVVNMQKEKAQNRIVRSKKTSKGDEKGANNKRNGENLEHQGARPGPGTKNGSISHTSQC